MPLKIPQLDDKTYEQIVAEVVARIPAHTPEWNNFNTSDPGITLVQLFAFMTENLLFRSNQIPEANRLKFLSLLGIPLNPASPGCGLVTFTNERGPLQALPLDEGLELFAGKVPFRTRTPVNILPVSAQVFYKKRQLSAALTAQQQNQYNTVYGSLLEDAAPAYYETAPLEPPIPGQPLPEVNLDPDTGDTIDGALWIALIAPKNAPLAEVCGAIGSKTLSLGIFPSLWTETAVLEAQTLESTRTLDPGLVVDIAAPEAPTVIEPRYMRLPVESADNVLEMPGIVHLTLPPAEALTRWNFDPSEEGTGDFPPLIADRALAARIVTWLRLRIIDSPGQAPRTRSLSWAGINAARVIQALRVERERIGIGTGTPGQVFKVANTPVIVERTIPGVRTPQYRFTLEVVDDRGKVEQWQRVDDLRAYGPDDLVYELDAEAGLVTCGDGLRGKRFPYGSTLRAAYEYGGGRQGEVAIGALNKAPTLPTGLKVSNPVKTWGATDSETVASAELKISRYLRHHDRLVTQDDFSELARHAPGVNIGRVEVLPLFDPLTFDRAQPSPYIPTPGVVTVMVVPQHPITQPDPPRPDRLYLEAIRSWLEPRRLITTQVFVRGPEWVPVYVALGIRLQPGQIGAVVHRRVRDAVRAHLSPLVGGIPPAGQPHGEGWPLGARLHPNDLIGVAARVEGVRYVEQIHLGIELPDPAQVGATRLQVIAGGSATEGYEFRGLELPWLAAIDVREGEAAPLEDLYGAEPEAGTPIPLPVIPKKC